MKQGDLVRILAGLILFAIAYALINSELLIHSILYRLAANDSSSAFFASISIMLQSLITLVLVVLLPKRFFGLLLGIVAVSTAINLTYSGILGEVVDRSKIAWMLVEARQSTNAAGQFAGDFAIAAFKTGMALLLLAGTRYYLRPAVNRFTIRFKPAQTSSILLSLTALVAYVLIPFSVTGSVASERNALVYAAQVAMADPAPERALVTIDPDPTRQIEKIVWLIDESISHDIFQKVIKPELKGHTFLDFGPVMALGNCSTPANFALRSGVDVVNASHDTDLRSTPSIWRYAEKAGYQTLLVDGQVAGPPQNMLLPPERKLIDQYDSAASGLDTDRKLARRLNGLIKSPGKQFIYVVLRGVHFQYTDHYPNGVSDGNLSVHEQYENAVRYSKKDFFAQLLDGVSRDRAAIIYTSDHGQNIADDAMPHCSVNPTKAEFSIPLVAFLPTAEAQKLTHQTDGPRSASQIFPTTLNWMGFPGRYAQTRYDQDLFNPSKRLIWFGRTVVPLDASDKIEVYPIPKR
ncbi:MAG: hypothetical protein Pars2KO_12610 [Parasphingorhabdus sp.]